MLIMENKYYTPQIEEFKVGFGFENRTLDFDDLWSEWVNREINNLCNLGTLDRLLGKDFYLVEDIKDYQIRVKYLDKSDIESFGLVETEPDRTRDKFMASLAFKIDNYTMAFYPYVDSIPDKLRGKLFIINHVFSSDGLELGESMHFCGTLKNKSELEFILKSIGIIK